MSYRTANLQTLHFIIFIQHIYVLNVLKHAAYSPFFPLQNAVYFIMLPCIIHTLNTGVLKFKTKSPPVKVNTVVPTEIAHQLLTCAHNLRNSSNINLKIYTTSYRNFK
jgi:hypothetical protein